MLRLFVDWDSIDHHIKFTESELRLLASLSSLVHVWQTLYNPMNIYTDTLSNFTDNSKALSDHLAKIMDDAPSVRHASMTPHPPSAAKRHLLARDGMGHPLHLRHRQIRPRAS